VHNWLNNYFLTLGLAVRVESSGLHILIWTHLIFSCGVASKKMFMLWE
jgi:hypothetical protein